MTKPKLIENEFYHIYNRGVSKQKIFHDAEDYQRFLKLLYICNNKKKFKFKDLLKYKKNIYDLDRDQELAQISFYVLMPNHFHILISSTFTKGGLNITTFVKKVSIGYAQYYNNKYKRTGTLFEGRFKAEHVDSDNYLKYLFSYIHLNPIKLIQSDWREKGIKNFEKAKQFLLNYNYSSHNDYLNPTQTKVGQNKIIDKHSFLKMFDHKVDFQKDIFTWLTLSTFTKGGLKK